MDTSARSCRPWGSDFVRGGFFGDVDFARSMGSELADIAMAKASCGLGDTSSTRLPSSGYAGLLSSSPHEFRLTPRGDAEVNVMAYVDRASFPGCTDAELDCYSTRQNFDSSPPRSADSCASRPTYAARTLEKADELAAPRLATPVVDSDWEADLLAWKRKYGCPEVVSGHEPEALMTIAPHQVATFATHILSTDATRRANAHLATLPVSDPSHNQPSIPHGGISDFKEEISRAIEERAELKNLHFSHDKVVVSDPASASAHPAFPADRTMVSGDGMNETLLGSAVLAESLGALAPRGQRDGGQICARSSEYTKEDHERATTTALARLQPDGSYKTEYSENRLRTRDLLVDLRKQRDKDKGRQATGPLWVHLSGQAKNVADSLDLEELLECLKLFISVRYDDYELYMRLLGEVPHYIMLATTDQLCQLIRLLARRRLRERNYVDMVAAHLLQKLRTSDDALPPRLLVKTANAFSSLECRSQPKFVEHFLRHLEHRISELDAELCCLFSPLFVDNYMSDSLRRLYLKRCAETQAGFHDINMELVRNLAVTELLIRKEYHSFAVSLPNYVTRFLDKVKRFADCDGWGAVSLPKPHVPDGPKGNHTGEIFLAVQRKAAAITGGPKADVFGSDMHRDVSACLNHLGIEHENGVLSGPFLIDIVAMDMVNPSKRIIYEINSPYHYYEGTEVVVAEKRLRQRLLQRLGHKLHTVHAHAWRALSSAQKMKFMLALQQAQQEENERDLMQRAIANSVRAPAVHAALYDYNEVKSPEPLRLKCASGLASGPIRVPVPPSAMRQGMARPRSQAEHRA